jgi:hypothetical protein
MEGDGFSAVIRFRRSHPITSGERKVKAEKLSAGFAELFSTIKRFIFNNFSQEISH